MTRAVIKLSGDISPAMPWLSKRISGCAYHPEAKLLAFRYQNMVVNVEPQVINVSNIEDEREVKVLMDWLSGTVNGIDKK
jgi:hypothetical protein